jgi:hypothetical protein
MVPEVGVEENSIADSKDVADSSKGQKAQKC